MLWLVVSWTNRTVYQQWPSHQSFRSKFTFSLCFFCSLNYNHDLSSASLPNQAILKLPTNVKEARSTHTVQRHLIKPTLIDSNEWLKEKAEGHEWMKVQVAKANRMTTLHRMPPEQNPALKFLHPPQKIVNQVIQLTIAKHPSLLSQIVWSARTNILFGRDLLSKKRHPPKLQRP